MTKKARLPEVVYIVLDTSDTDSPMLLAYEDISDIEDGTIVGTYELSELNRVVVTHDVVRVK